MLSEILRKFVVLEGLDGSGTTTQIDLLDTRLGEGGIAHLCTCEPTRGSVGLLIRRILRGETRVHPKTLSLLFAADRTEHLEREGEGIVDSVGRGEVVISDRYLFSSLAYQSLGSDFEYVWELNRRFPLPQLLVFLDTPPEVCQRRLARRIGSDLFDHLDTQRRVRENYLQSVRRFKDTAMRVLLLDGNLAPDRLFKKIWSEMERMSIL
jgi:dTMP kinase